MNLQRAIEIAAEAHRGQADKAGDPYILHPLRVMSAVTTDEERIVAVLHDVVEDGGPDWTFERLEAEGFNAAVIEALRLVTKRPEDEGNDMETYLRFVRRTMESPVARRVKRADIRDNLDATLDLPGKCGEHQLRNQEVFYGKREQTDAGVSA